MMLARLLTSVELSFPLKPQIAIQKKSDARHAVMDCQQGRYRNVIQGGGGRGDGGGVAGVMEEGFDPRVRNSFF